MADAPPLPPAPPPPNARIVDADGRPTAEFTLWLAKLQAYLGGLTPPVGARSIQSLADWLRANMP